jgi:hypothetical protein
MYVERKTPGGMLVRPAENGLGWGNGGAGDNKGANS